MFELNYPKVNYFSNFPKFQKCQKINYFNMKAGK